MSRWFVGVDYSTKTVAMAAHCPTLNVKGRIMTQVNLPGRSPAEDCYLTYRAVLSFLDEVEQLVSVAIAESPLVGFGGRANIQTTIGMARIHGAILTALYTRAAHVLVAQPAEWKKAVVGIGNATKDEIAEYVGDAWPKVYIAAQGSQDLIDAYCMSKYAAIISERMDGSSVVPSSGKKRNT